MISPTHMGIWQEIHQGIEEIKEMPGGGRPGPAQARGRPNRRLGFRMCSVYVCISVSIEYNVIQLNSTRCSPRACPRSGALAPGRRGSVFCAYRVYILYILMYLYICIFVFSVIFACTICSLRATGSLAPYRPRCGSSLAWKIWAFITTGSLAPYPPY